MFAPANRGFSFTTCGGQAFGTALRGKEDLNADYNGKKR